MRFFPEQDHEETVKSLRAQLELDEARQVISVCVLCEDLYV